MTASSHRTDNEVEVLLHHVTSNDLARIAAPRVLEKTTVGESLRVAAFTGAGGGITITFARGSHKMVTRASGKVFYYWSNDQVLTLHRTRRDLVVLRSTSTDSNRVRTMTERLYLSGTQTAAEVLDAQLRRHFRNDVRAQIQQVIDRVHELIGELPNLEQRFPLLACEDSAEFTTRLNDMVNARAHAADPWLDSHDSAHVAKKLFGIKAYRKPMAAQVARHHADTLAWFSLFRGLVPPEHIIAALAAIEHPHIQQQQVYSREMRAVRAVLVRTPAPILSRILKAPLPIVMRQLIDTGLGGTTRDLNLLPELISTRGQRHVRGANELHNLVYSIPEQAPRPSARSASANAAITAERTLHRQLHAVNHANGLLGREQVSWAQWAGDTALRERVLLEHHQVQHALLTEQQRRAELEAQERQAARLRAHADRAAWAAETAAALEQQATLAELTITVAQRPEQLASWEAEMSNCIGDYGSTLGLTVLFALTDPITGAMVINAQINHEQGLVQFLGKHNRNAHSTSLGEAGTAAALAQLTALGITVYHHCWGLPVSAKRTR